jgi:hypothetical protein
MGADGALPSSRFFDRRCRALRAAPRHPFLFAREVRSSLSADSPQKSPIHLCMADFPWPESRFRRCENDRAPSKPPQKSRRDFVAKFFKTEMIPPSTLTSPAEL